MGCGERWACGRECEGRGGRMVCVLPGRRTGVRVGGRAQRREGRGSHPYTPATAPSRVHPWRPAAASQLLRQPPLLRGGRQPRHRQPAGQGGGRGGGNPWAHARSGRWVPPRCPEWLLLSPASHPAACRLRPPFLSKQPAHPRPRSRLPPSPSGQPAWSSLCHCQCAQAASACGCLTYTPARPAGRLHPVSSCARLCRPGAAC